ncbi:MAG: CinA family nicotinamide mononucleotide deamidase-related protein, partial [Pseudomonadales bacterium]|nr:CinA family nicotinamide mononucleotide deamidase-related protein [Pseudomonadales bacterium]
MKLEMICTGEEILSGQIVDTNAAWLGNQLLEQGFEMQRRSTVGDRLADLVDVFQERSQHADIILVNGGLGPTADDLSAQAMADAMGVALQQNQHWLSVLEQWFSSRGTLLSKSNLKQTMLPEGAIMVDNPVGTACGFRVKLNRAWLFFTPGVPSEFKHMVQQQFIPFVEQQSRQKQRVDVTKLLTLGMGESTMAQLLESVQWPEGVTLGYRSYSPYLELKLICRIVSAADQQAALLQAQELLNDTIVAHNQPCLAAEVHSLLVDSGQTLAIAESLTGGEISSQLVAFAGSSRYLQHAVVSYCNLAKTELLKVSEKTISDYSEVSMACVAQMLTGASSALSGRMTDYAVATSGIAGPSGGSTDHPVGTVVIGVKVANTLYCQKLLIAG